MKCHPIEFGTQMVHAGSGPSHRNAIMSTGEYQGLAFLSQAMDANDLVILHGKDKGPEPWDLQEDAKLVLQDPGYPRIWIGKVASLFRYKK